LQDLVVVCANCHLLLHLDSEHALTAESLRRMLRL
jgi:predicted HNH restriction endonuclease